MDSGGDKRNAPHQASPQPNMHIQMSTHTRGEELPLYSEDRLSMLETIAELKMKIRSANTSEIPILTYPQHASTEKLDWNEHFGYCQTAIALYFDAIKSGNIESVAAFIGAKLVTVETSGKDGKTPLLAAIEADYPYMVRYLLDIGADINAYGITGIVRLQPLRYGRKDEKNIYRTPLQFAAQTGNIPIVKLLMDRGANDALIAADGQLALRLAAANGHREIVDYLPSRRGGGFRRWKMEHANAMRRCKRAAHGMYLFGKFFIWHIPRFVLWSIPKHCIVLPLIKGVKWVHLHRRRIPKILADAAKAAADGLKKLPARVWNVIKRLPGWIWECLKECGKFIWRSIKRLPHGIKIALLWLWSGIKNIGATIGNIFARLLSCIHTICAAIGNFFRHITLRDVFNALKRVL